MKSEIRNPKSERNPSFEFRIPNSRIGHPEAVGRSKHTSNHRIRAFFSGFGLRTSFGFRISSFGLLSDFGFRASDFFRISDFLLRISDFGIRISFGLRISVFGFLSDFGFRLSDFFPDPPSRRPGRHLRLLHPHSPRKTHLPPAFLRPPRSRKIPRPPQNRPHRLSRPRPRTAPRQPRHPRPHRPVP